MKNNEDRQGNKGSSSRSLYPNHDPRKAESSLLSFPGAWAGRAESASERHARARARKESRPSDLLGALAGAKSDQRRQPAEQTQYEPDPDATDDPSLLERILRKGRTSTRIPKAAVTSENVAAPSYVSDQRPVYREPARETLSRVPPDNADQVSAYQSPRFQRQDDDDGWKPLIDPRRVIDGIIDAKGLIIVLTLLGAGLGAAYAISAPKKFEATAEISIDPRPLNIADRPLTEVSGLPSDSTIALVENQVRVLTSGPVLNAVVDKLGLIDDPDFNGQGGFSLNPINFVRGLLTRSDVASDPGRQRAETITALAKRVTVERTGRTFVVLINAVTPEAEKSARIANAMINAYVEVSGKIQAESAGRANSEVVAQLDRLRKELEVAEQKVEKFRSDNDLAVAQGRLITDDEIVRLNDQLAAARARTLELNARAETARQMSVDAVVGGAIPEAAASSAVNDLRAQYAAAKQEADRISVRLGPRHPSYQSAQAQVAAVTTQITNELKRVSAQVQTELTRSVQLEQEMASRLAQLKVRQGAVSSELVALRDLERDAQAKRSVYEGYLLRAQETREQKEIDTANISVISLATPPIHASGTSRAVITIAGALAGLLAGIGIGTLRGLAGGLGDTLRDDRSRSSGRSPRPMGQQPNDHMPARKREEESPADEEEPMNPLYPPHGYAPYPQQPMAQPQAQPHYQHQGFPQQPVYPPQGYAQQPMPHMQQPMYPQQAQPYPAPMPYAQPQPYPPQPYPPQAYPQAWPLPAPQPVYAQPPMPPQPVYTQPYPAPTQPVQPAVQEQTGGFASIGDSVREFRDAVRELTETRSRRRYF